MAKIYYLLIKGGKMELKNVPPHWYDDVQEMLDADASAKE